MIAKAEIVWLNRDDFVKHVERSTPTAGLWNKEDIFSLSGIDAQLSSFYDKGIILLRTRTNKFDLGEFAVRKINGVWKFSISSQEVENVKY